MQWFNRTQNQEEFEKRILVMTTEMKAVAALLGVPGVLLYRGFSTRTRDSHGQLCRTITDAQAVSVCLVVLLL